MALVPGQRCAQVRLSVSDARTVEPERLGTVHSVLLQLGTELRRDAQSRLHEQARRGDRGRISLPHRDEQRLTRRQLAAARRGGACGTQLPAVQGPVGLHLPPASRRYGLGDQRQPLLRGLRPRTGGHQRHVPATLGPPRLLRRQLARGRPRRAVPDDRPVAGDRRTALHATARSPFQWPLAAAGTLRGSARRRGRLLHARGLGDRRARHRQARAALHLAYAWRVRHSVSRLPGHGLLPELPVGGHEPADRAGGADLPVRHRAPGEPRCGTRVRATGPQPPDHARAATALQLYSVPRPEHVARV